MNQIIRYCTDISTQNMMCGDIYTYIYLGGGEWCLGGRTTVVGGGIEVDDEEYGLLLLHLRLHRWSGRWCRGEWKRKMDSSGRTGLIF